ncbi:hypothetical protein PAT3040_03781 [Paenibacillus agaridevorans]|uniref:Uncharacterized protein n=1 Tax=Paenibacillus agaridevorans TaxID=171404 RepID=A0A2R5EVT6_9BACL|nr:hypothetical protein PAT3040_03781 [Paenibacillus agaridevorans]
MEFLHEADPLSDYVRGAGFGTRIWTLASDIELTRVPAKKGFLSRRQHFSNPSAP